jgi:hypothetical protein
MFHSRHQAVSRTPRRANVEKRTARVTPGRSPAMPPHLTTSGEVSCRKLPFIERIGPMRTASPISFYFFPIHQF